MDARAYAIGLLKTALARSMRHRLGFKLTRLVAEEHQLFSTSKIAASCAPAVARRLGDTVLRGPFRGLQYPETRRASSDRLRKLLGAYEAELHPVLEEVCRRPRQTVINIGAAEGYYAVGLARRLPDATVYAFERDPAAVAALVHLARLNGAAERVLIRGCCTREALARCPMSPGTFVVSDCEGCEYDVLQPAVIPALLFCDFLIELHRRRDLSPRQHFSALFAKTHRLEFIEVQRHGPNAYPELAGCSTEEREALLFERTDRNGWAYLRRATETGGCD